MIIVNLFLFLLLQTLLLGFTYEPYLVPLRLYLFGMIALTTSTGWISAILIIEMLWWICLGLMTFYHGIALAISLLLWRTILAYIKWTPFFFGCMLWMFTFLSLLPVIRWTAGKIIATMIIAALVAWYLTRYGRQSRELYNS